MCRGCEQPSVRLAIYPRAQRTQPHVLERGPRLPKRSYPVYRGEIVRCLVRFTFVYLGESGVDQGAPNAFWQAVTLSIPTSQSIAAVFK